MRRFTSRGRFATLALAGTALAGCAGAAVDFDSMRDSGDYNVLLVTIDTLRADHVGAYGFAGGTTPVLDGLAARGVLFERAYSPTPLTLPAHSSLMTGTYPAFHGVRDNGAFVIPESLDTLAKVYGRSGYRTAAFVAAFVLDSRWGLGGGFDTYYDEFTLPKEQVVGLGAVQRDGAQVVDEALAWMRAHDGTPYFLWVHLYDPHTPYTPPEPFRSRFEGSPYLGEVAYADHQLGRLLQGLDPAARDRTFIVVAADHGEGLGDHGEIEHGFFLYEESIRVPLVVSTPFAQLHGLRRTELVSLVDVMPTLLEMSRLPVPASVQGESMVALLGAAPASWRDEVYAESYYPRLHFGWSELKALRGDRHKFILSPQPEMYDLQSDPAETLDVAAQYNVAFAQLSDRVAELEAAQSEGAVANSAMELDEDTRSRLAALGYLGTTAALIGDGDDLPNPRDKIGTYNDLLRAKTLKLHGDLAGAQALLETIVAADPGVIDAYVTLGTLYSVQGGHQQAIDTYEAALGHKPGDLSLVLLLVGENIKLARFERALQVIADFEDLLPQDPRLFYTRGNVHRFLGDVESAITDYRRSVEINPDAAPAWTALAGALVSARRFDEARTAVDRALALDAQAPDANFVVGQLAQHDDDLAGAEAAYLRELGTTPDHLRAAYNLSIVYRELGREPEEERYLRRTIEINPDFPLSHLYLARLYMRHGQNLDAAIRGAEWASRQDLADRDLAFAYFLLADLYNRVGRPELARQYATRGEEVSRRLTAAPR